MFWLLVKLVGALGELCDIDIPIDGGRAELDPDG